ncbi:glycosyltransferase involved in cell wall biosynthesis [Elizabethkingia sp. YR214]|uniref:glycosyltransferase n=1 Tax=Elizabethkingia sp. YR214 TaxID=2135667 RepID=UPI000D3071BD|nr:glycosyltransferase [Elizabethkingia sp. YR214]PUB28533.1 glycosyltransferase involved in cell wall biosynthesis [Elizabethkingia sp. YR214]
MKILQLNVVSNSGSTGRIAESIGKYIVIGNGESHIAYGRYGNPSSFSKTYRIGDKFDIYMHVLKTRFFDRHGFASKTATKRLIQEIDVIKPDLIQLHVIHGYYLNIEILFHYLSNLNIPIVWTFHDCWAFTGHCSHFVSIDCQKWQTHCNRCELISAYPKSYTDNSYSNFLKKRDLFNSVKNLTIVSPSSWILSEVNKSFFKGVRTVLINNGINLEKFKPILSNFLKLKFNFAKEIIILGVASTWDKRKGIDDFLRLAKKLDDRYRIIMVGLTEEQINKLPPDIIGITKTESIEELAEYYSVADVFFNPTYEDTFPTTNIEALACGTPVVTYDVGGSPEILDESTGVVVPKGNIDLVIEAINKINKKTTDYYSNNCRLRAEKKYNEEDNFKKYIDLYQKLINKE